VKPEPATPDINAYSLPWRLLVSPVSAWRLIAEHPSAWPALFTQWILVLAYGLLAARPLAELWSAAGLGSIAANSNTMSHIVGLLLFLPLNIALAALCAWLVRLTLQALSIKLSFRQALTWTAYGALPVFLGRFLGFIGFAIVQPLSNDARDAWALQFNPFSPGLAGMFERLSYPWVLACSFDLFGLWSLLLLALGARHFLRLSPGQSAWAIALLVLLWLAALTLVWRGMLAGAV
jgi:hypothetical protein